MRWLVAVRSGHAGRGLARVLDHELGAAAARVDLAGLDDAALSELVMSRFPGRWSPGVLRQVVALAAGSPYAALELARETAALRRPRRDSGPPAVRRWPARCAAGWLGSALRCWPWCRPRRWPGRRRGRCCARSPAGPLMGGWMRRWRRAYWTQTPPDPVLRFSHPLLREAAEGMLTGPGRRRLHRAIGGALDDPDEAAWHLARGADEPDEALAERAEHAAQHASARGAPARAAALAHAAAELTPDPDSLHAWRRRISWLEQLVAAGEFEQVRRLGEKWALDVPASLRGRLTAVRADVESRHRGGCAACYGEAFEDLAGRDPARAAQAGTERCLNLGILLGRLDDARSRTGGHRAGTCGREPGRLAGSAGRGWASRGDGGRRRCRRPAAGGGAAARVHRHAFPLRGPRDGCWPSGTCGAASSTRPGTC